ncbi:MAG: preprotein translocase subunit SecA [Candidatus Omnitrophica bacterium]|nr:preprotein translocase subunit SecA [Candidatus Omnitrophota bacterium]MBU4457124.1 preprotein translocase subunit SecA [Candidatus Omnitrophota bacterium]
MFTWILNKIIGSQNERELKKLQPIADKISSLEPEMQKLSDADLREKTDEFRERLSKGEELDNILPEAFAVVRETARRTIGMRHFDVQLVGGIVLHQGKIAEMATGEGKTLVATLAAYLNALAGKGVHIITVNDYLARRDREWMGPVFEFLGLSVGVIQHDMGPQLRQMAYGSDIAYGTNNEFGFDYLRDNMVARKEEMVQRGLNYAIVDEVDSILIDEARTPLIISGPSEESTDKYYTCNKIVPRLKGRIILEKDEIDAKFKGIDLSKGYDYIVDEKAHTAHLTEDGEAKVAEMLGIENMHDMSTMEYRHHVIQALKAHNLFEKDVDYVVKEEGVIIVDEFTGRLMPGRRWSDGLHQAIEAKEGIKIERENQTLATITFQNYFKMYNKLSGMTGTAMTEANEFSHIYKLDTMSVPTNKILLRTNHPDVIFKTEKEKFNAACNEIEELYRKGRPVLVGTISIEKSERLSSLLKKRGIPHNVLNAKYHELEATIVGQAGRFQGVTIATNMAGRGTDILLGGNPEFMADDWLKAKGMSRKSVTQEESSALLTEAKARVKEEHEKVVALGGLHVMGTERHESRRVDNQLRGRSGRQGDPGSSRFYISLEDDLMRLFGSGRISAVYDKLGIEEGQDIQHPLVSRAIEVAQKRVEQHNFDIRKHVLEYDNVMNKQREVIYDERKKILMGDDVRGHIYEIMEELIDGAIELYLNPDVQRLDWKYAEFREWLWSKFNMRIEGLEDMAEGKDRDGILEEVVKLVKFSYEEKEKRMGPDLLRHMEKMLMLQVIDTKWKDHLHAMDNLREGIGLRAYGQRDPLVEYQHEGYDMFREMIGSIKDETVEFLFKVEAVREEGRVKGVFQSLPQEFLHTKATPMSRIPTPRASEPDLEKDLPQQDESQQYKREESKVGRNDPCPCASGKKYKKCCGR